MAKRFTETAKWVDKWFRALPPPNKLAWLYLTDNCDAAGIIDLDTELANFQAGENIDWEAFLKLAGDRIRVIHKGKWFLTGFVKFQYGKLSPECKPHIPVISLLQRHGIDIEEIDQNDAFRHGKIDAGRRLKVYERDDYTCCYCGFSYDAKDLEPDHVVPVTRGGNDAMGNLVASCRPCNRLKYDRSPQEFINSLPHPGLVWKRLSERLPERLYQSLEEKDKEKDQDQDKEKKREGGLGETEDDNFAAWWSTVPLKVGKQAAAKAYRAAVRRIGGDAPHAYLLERMTEFAATPKAKGDYCPHPATWLNEGRYEDDPATWRNAGNAKGKSDGKRDIGPGQRYDPATETRPPAIGW